uniref:cysteine dioxygenase n=1 Tax=Oryza sativa TaxID=4530 RepID=Q259Q2_ORYSA|nr:H0818H01.17 [Oryza sativa]
MDQSERHHRLASTAADWCFRLHGWPIMLPLLGVYVFTDRPPRPLPSGVSACTAGLYAAVVGRLRLHRPAASTAADWCFRLHGWPLCCRCWASTSSPTGRLVRCRLVFPPARLAFMLPLLGVYVFTDRPPRPLPTGVSACTAGLYAAVVGRLRLHRPACLRCCRLVFPPARLAFMPPLLGVYVFTDRLAFAAADWCFRLHGWPLCRRCWASTSSPTGLPSPLPTGVSACTAGLYAAVVGRLRLHRLAALSAAD